MPTTDTKLQQLVINVGTKAQIESAIAGGTITQDMLSVATDGDTYIQGVKVNGTELTPDANNKVDVLTSDILPSQTSQSGKYLTTNGVSASWGTIDFSNFVTLNTSQKIQAAKAIFGTDVAFGSDTTQKNLLAVISNNNATAGTWIGRLTVGAKNKTFIMGTYGSICVLGAHSWTNAQQGTGAAWEPVYINPDGDKAVYIGGSPINNKQALMVIQNVNANTTGTVKINRSTNLSNNFKDVACWDDNVSKFTNDAGYITGITSSDVTTALGYTPYNSTNPSGYQANVLEGVQVNGTDLTITNKKVNVSVPTQASDINAQPTLVSGTNIKTVNGNSLLGSGDLVISGLPSQTSQSGKFLTTNGTSASWANIPTEIPSQSGQNGKFLTTNGSSVSWATVNALPSQTGNSGKYLTTNGTTASWGEIAEYTAQEVETLWGSL